MKGISSVITAVLLTSVSVALASMYAGWAPDLSGNLTANIVEGAEKTTKCRNAALSIQNPYHDNNSETTFFTLKNTGSIRFSKEIQVIGLKSTKLNSTEVYGLDPGQSKKGSFETSSAPERILAQTVECPGIRSRSTDIEIRD